MPRSLRPRGNAEFLVNGLDVGGDRIAGQAQQGRNIGIAHATPNEGKNLSFARRQDFLVADSWARASKMLNDATCNRRRKSRNALRQLRQLEDDQLGGLFLENVAIRPRRERCNDVFVTSQNGV